MQTRLAEKLINVFRPESLGRLARRKQGRERCEIKLVFADHRCDFEFSFSTNSKTEVQADQVPEAWLENAPAYIPTRGNYSGVYEVSRVSALRS
ncbi:MAG: ATP-binding protein, partial [Prochlorothrix sp.]